MDVTTLCYLEKDGKYLMLHRTKKENDVNEGKWIAVGGHCENAESPEDCAAREVFEETGYTVNSLKFRGIVTFFSMPDFTEYMCVFVAKDFEGREIECNEGELEWIEKDRINNLNIWEGDKIIHRLIADDNQPFFSLKLSYNGDTLEEAVLDGRKIR